MEQKLKKKREPKPQRPHTPESEKDASIARSQERRAKAEQERQTKNNELTRLGHLADSIAAEFGLDFIHIRRREIDPTDPLGFKTTIESKGGITVAYVAHTHHIEVALNRCSDDDQFCAKKGRFYAAENFEAGNTIKIPRPRGLDARAMLYGMFQWCILDRDGVRKVEKDRFLRKAGVRFSS